MELTQQQFEELNQKQKEAVQKQLADDGFYFGTVDGKWGPGTETAIKLSKKAASDKVTSDADAAVKKAGAGKTVAETEALKATTAAKKKYTEQASSPLGIGTTVAAGLPALLAGTAAGSKSGELINREMDASQAKKNITLAEAADDRIKGLTTREGARTGTTLAGAMPPQNSVLRVGGRMIPHMGLGALFAGKGASMLASENEGDPSFYPEMANRAGGVGMIGAGTGVMAQGIKHGVSPGVPPDAKSISIIESNQLRRQPGQTARTLAGGATKTELYREAQSLNLPGRSKMNRTQLAEALAKVKQIANKVPALAGPALAATLAYNLTPKQAEARGGEPSPGPSSAATNAALAGGTAYGVGKLAKALAGSRAGPFLGPAMMGVGTAASAYDYAQEAQEARQSMPQGTEYDMLAQAMPAAQRGGEMVEAWRNLPGQAQEFVQRNQSDPSMGMTNEVQAMPQQAPPGMHQMPDGSLMADADMQGQPAQPPNPMMQANAMAVPRDQIRQSQADMAFDPAMRGGPHQGMELPPEIQQQMQMLVQQGAPPELIASYLNHIAAQ